jgi:hypothetical protein
MLQMIFREDLPRFHREEEEEEDENYDGGS